MNINSNEFFIETEKLVKENAIGGAVVFLKGYSKKLFKKQLFLSYHLHFFFYENRERKELIIKCLDTNFFEKIQNFNPDNLTNSEKIIENKINLLINQFLKIISHISEREKIRPDSAFEKAPQFYWDIYNNIKEEYFCHAVNTINNNMLSQESKQNKKMKIGKTEYKTFIEDLFYDKKIPLGVYA